MISPFLPMLAVAAEPFDSHEFLFEVKWDGVRALASVEQGRWQLWGRGRADYTDRYPDLEVLGSLPAGCVLDGELVVLRQGRANLPALLRRHHLTSPFKIKQAGRQWPVTFIAFDCLYQQGRALFEQPLSARRAVLADLMSDQRGSPLMCSPGVIGCGRTFFEQVVQQEHEGVMGKLLSSRYRPGKRDSAWRKIKPWQTTAAVIIGYTPSRAGFSSLLVAAAQGNKLGYVARLTRGFSNWDRAQLTPRLMQNHCAQAAVPCRQPAQWVTPRLLCEVRFLTRTIRGHLKCASYLRLLDGADGRQPSDPG